MHDDSDDLKAIREELGRLSERIERLEQDSRAVRELVERQGRLPEGGSPADKSREGHEGGTLAAGSDPQSGVGSAQADGSDARSSDLRSGSEAVGSSGPGSYKGAEQGSGSGAQTPGPGPEAGQQSGSGSGQGQGSGKESGSGTTGAGSATGSDGAGWFKPGGSSPEFAYAGAARAGDSSLEAKIGQYWLNRIGIGSVVLGMVFLILYAFQQFGPMAKIATGIFFAMAMVVAGEVFGKKDKGDWFWRGFIGGGWALMYFTTFAAYHVDYVRVIPSPHLDFLLLLLVAGGAVAHALKYESVIVTAMALSLALVSICFAPAGFFSALSGLLILGSLCWIVMKMGWHGMLTYGVTAYYLASLSKFIPFLMSQTGPPPEILNTALWCASWVIVVWTVMKLPDQVGSKRTNLIVVSLINAFMFSIGIRLLLGDASFLSYDGIYAGFGLAYLVLAHQCRQTSRLGLMNTFCLIGVSLLTLFFGSRLTGQAEEIAYLIEVPLLVAVGINSRISALRWFAAFMAIVCAVWSTVELSSGYGNFDPGSWRFQGAFLTMLSFAVCCWLYRVKGREAENISPTFGFYFYFISAWLLSLVTVQLHWPHELIFGSFVLCCALPVVFGFWLKEQPLRYLGCCAIVFLGVPNWLTMLGLNWNARDGWFAVVVLASLVYLYIGMRDKIEESERVCGHIYSLLCTIVVASLLGRQFENYQLTLSWAVEGMILLVVGFSCKDKVLRVLGLVMFGLVVCKLLFVDMAQADTVYRILSFIGAGIMLIVASFAYMKLTSQIDDKADGAQSP